MKSFLIALMALVSFQASADSLDLTQVVATVSMHRYGINEVALLDDGRLQVVTKDNEVVTRELNPAAYQFLRAAAASVANAELVVEKRENVCMFIKAPFSPALSVADYDYETAAFSGELELSLSARHCGMHVVTYPKEARLLEEAVSLKDRLILLALETAGKSSEF